ncbi:hypothetical protein VPHK567_0119 [Vibrio phage K567]|nr:hypothetical protein MYOV011v1_p0088 [Vibrio phage 6E35.1a]
MQHFVFQNGKPVQTGDPNEFMSKMPAFLKELQKRLDADPRGGKIIYAGPAKADNLTGIDVEIEDKNGKVSKFFINPYQQSFYTVFG